MPYYIRKAKKQVNSHKIDNLKGLILSSAKGDNSAFHQLYEHLSDQLFRFILARCQSRQDALDLLQDIFIDLWKAMSRFKYSSDQEFYGFVYRIARRKLAKYYKSNPKIVEFNEEYIKENFEINHQDDWLITKVLPRIKTKYRQVLELRYWSDFSFAQIAKALDLKESTVKVQHHRALKQLNNIMKDYE